MREWYLLIVGMVIAPLFDSKIHSLERQLERTIATARNAASNKSRIKIKPLNKMLLAPQDVTGPGGGKLKNKFFA
jgi:hypothetical protein